MLFWSQIDLFNSSPSIKEFWQLKHPNVCISVNLSNTILNESDVFHCCLEFKQSIVKMFIFKMCDIDLPCTDLGLHLTRYLIMVNMCAKLLGNLMMHGSDVGRTVLWNISHFDLWPLSVTLTFEVQAWVLCTTCHLLIVNTCAQLLGNP